MSDFDWGPVKEPTPRQGKIIDTEMRKFGQMQTARNVTANQWEEVAELILPTSRNTFMYGSYNTPGVKKTDRQIDATGAAALAKFGAICESLITPRNQQWHGLRASDTTLMANRDVKLWFENATKQLFKYRYSPLANFSSQNYQHLISLGAFGTGGMFIDAFDNDQPGMHAVRGLRYKNIPP